LLGTLLRFDNCGFYRGGKAGAWGKSLWAQFVMIVWSSKLPSVTMTLVQKIHRGELSLTSTPRPTTAKEAGDKVLNIDESCSAVTLSLLRRVQILLEDGGPGAALNKLGARAAQDTDFVVPDYVHRGAPEAGDDAGTMGEFCKPVEQGDDEPTPREIVGMGGEVPDAFIADAQGVDIHASTAAELNETPTVMMLAEAALTQWCEKMRIILSAEGRADAKEQFGLSEEE
jgi:hypothetical protein